MALALGHSDLRLLQGLFENLHRVPHSDPIM